jgi:hypothetical protein
MAKDKDENGDGGKTENVLAEAMRMLAENQRIMLEQQPKRVIEEGSPEYRDRLVKEGFFDEFPKPVYQNGKKAVARGLPVETRERAANLTPGEYTVGKVKVTVERTPDDGIHLKYKSKTPDDRMAYASAWMDLPDLVNKLWAQMTLVSA